MKPTKEDIIKFIAELKDAMIDNMEAAQLEEKVKLAKIKAQKRLSLARDALRNIEF